MLVSKAKQYSMTKCNERHGTRDESKEADVVTQFMRSERPRQHVRQ